MAIRFEAVSLRVGERSLLADVSVHVRPGERVALIGPSGAGKTTFLRLASGLAWPTAGSVHVLGKRTGSLHGRALRNLRRRIGYLHQHDNLVPQLRVAHNVLIGRLGHWSLARALWSLLWPREVPRAAAALAAVELEDRLWALPDQLSGGEQQRVAIARLLVQEPEVVLADEPVSSLDVRLGREIVDRVLALADPTRAVVISLHSLTLLRAGFDRVLALRGGALVFSGTPSELTTERLAMIYGSDLAAMDGRTA